MPQPTPRKYDDFPPGTQRVIDNLILLGIRVYRRVQVEAAANRDASESKTQDRLAS